MLAKNENDLKIFQYFSTKGPPKFTQIGIFGLKINHLATLVPKSDYITGLRLAFFPWHRTSVSGAQMNHRYLN
jgi:hypothetical protein